LLTARLRREPRPERDEGLSRTVVDIATPAIVTTEDGSHEMLTITGNKAEAMVAIKKARHAFLQISVT